MAYLLCGIAECKIEQKRRDGTMEISTNIGRLSAANIDKLIIRNAEHVTTQCGWSHILFHIPTLSAGRCHISHAIKTNIQLTRLEVIILIVIFITSSHFHSRPLEKTLAIHSQRLTYTKAPLAGNGGHVVTWPVKSKKFCELPAALPTVGIP